MFTHIVNLFTMCRLLAHANALINRVSSFMTKPVDAKYGGKKPIVSSGEKIKLNVETAGVSTCGNN